MVRKVTGNVPSDELVDLSSDQTVTGKKNFIKLSVGGKPIEDLLGEGGGGGGGGGSATSGTPHGGHGGRGECRIWAF